MNGKSNLTPNSVTHIARSSLIIAVFFGIDKILGFIRQLLVARQFGLTYEIDVFNAANNIPDLLSALISGGALGVALIPVLSEAIQKQGRSNAWDIFSRTINLAFIATGAVSVLIIALADPLVRNLIAPGFPEAQKLLTIQLMRLDLIAILIFAISGLVMAGLQANQHFLLPAAAPALYNIGQIFGIAILAPETGIHLGSVELPAFGYGIFGLVYGVIIGALLHLAIQIPGLKKFHFHWTPTIDLRHPGLRKVLRMLGPRLLTMFFLQIFFIVRDNLASHLGEGSVTALNYGWFIMQVPETLIGSALAIALLPTIAELYANRDYEAFEETIQKAISVLLALTIPVAFLLAVCIGPLIPFLFGFDSTGSQLVIWVTRAYLLGLCGHALLETATRSFYAQQDARTPLYLAALNALIYIIIATSLSQRLGAAGIALGNSIAFSSEALLLLIILRRSYPKVLKVGKPLARAMLAGSAAALAALLILRLPFHSIWTSLIALTVGGALALPAIWIEIKTLLKL